ncbi:hypothetical protein MBAV_000558 [Candidatus Magnetobacterium bavaricum]|uniref:Uncharacterized protein n=1 Tax=Candidatus Magnetobacterium bavaricum TaxID=29290 RepID=A0A0F3GZD2_9BACT|nr:hypothetical protein MBAV_000558 [Candidatus Magnetobacterium bavaricum]
MRSSSSSKLMALPSGKSVGEQAIKSILSASFLGCAWLDLPLSSTSRITWMLWASRTKLPLCSSSNGNCVRS